MNDFTGGSKEISTPPALARPLLYKVPKPVISIEQHSAVAASRLTPSGAG
jgi:hypothetical protein